MADLVGKIVAVARAAVDRLFQRSSIRFGLGRTEQGHKTLFVSVNDKHTIPGIYVSAAREFGVHPRPKVLDQIRKVAGGYLDAQHKASKAAITRVVENILRNAPEGKPSAAVKQQLGEAITSVLDKTTSAMERIASTEAIAARNLGSLEAITAMGITAGVQDPTVYFVIVRDGQACKECVRLHMFGPVEPRLWRRSEVGSGYHLPGEDFPSLFGEHPHCRCQLTIMLPGWDFNEAGFAHYVAPGHDALKRQRGG